jgi:Protein of unknown function (DUF2891)
LSSLTAGSLAAGWLDRLRPELAGYANVALENIGREYPAHIIHLMNEPGDFPSRPSDRNPVFYGSLDWHSCVEMFWLLVRLLKVAPDDVPAEAIRDALEARLTADGLRAEAAFIDGAATERPYGWGWALALAAELETWDDPDGRRWAARFRPLSHAITDNFVRWLPVATYPLRTGVHTNTAFGISRALSYADLQPDGELSEALRGAASRWFGADEDYPGGWEPSGQDFLSAALCEAELLARLLPREDYPDWLGRFLPGIADRQPAALFTPAVVTDSSDGYLAHLRGLNLSRAWCFRRLAESLPSGDPRTAACEQASVVHAEASLAYVIGDDYMVEHWLAAYAVLLFS